MPKKFDQAQLVTLTVDFNRKATLTRNEDSYQINKDYNIETLNS